jgi:hypothetical protein
MKMLEVQFAELKENIVAAEVKKGFSEAAAQTAITDAGVYKGETIEQRLSELKKYAKKVGITESGRPARIQRKNGSAINEAGTEDRVQSYMRKMNLNFREASIVCGLPDPGPHAKQPAAFTESLVKAWKDYCGGLISESDARTLAERGISPE